MAKQQQKKLAPVMAIVNMKGGVGKTTISAHLSREFYRETEKNVLVVDLDPQFNLTQTVFHEKKYERFKRDGKTVLSVMESPESTSLYDTHETDGEIPEISDVVVNVKFLWRETTDNWVARLDILPGDFSLCKFSLMEDRDLIETAGKRFAQFIEKARETYDLVCIDCNPSSSFLTVCALKASTHLLVPVRPDRYSMLGLRMLDNFISRFKALAIKPKKIIILNGIPKSGYDPTVENELRSDPEYGPITLTTSLYMTKLLAANPRYTGFATDRKVAHSTSLQVRMSTLSRELAAALGLK
ncbi:MAG: ParA family protein [Pseudomonas sp.]|nr:ParA family protein [Pseudomonas sp.]